MTRLKNPSLFETTHLTVTLELLAFFVILSSSWVQSAVQIKTQSIQIIVPKGNAVIVETSFLPFPKWSIHVEQQPAVYREDGTMSILQNLSFAFDICYVADVRTSLVIFVQTETQFLETVKNITGIAARSRMEKDMRQSNCEVFIFNQTCNHNMNYNVKDFQTNSNGSDFPFDWPSDLYLIHYCELQQDLRFWEIYSVKNILFVKQIHRQKNVRKGVKVNLTDFSLNNMTKVMRRQNLDGIDITAAVFLTDGNEDENQFEILIRKDENGEDKLVSGLSANIFRDFQATMNFTEKVLKIYFSLDNYFATSFTSNDYQFDINMFHSTVSKNRSMVAQPLHPTFFDGVHGVFVQPFDQSVRNIYRKPFAAQMWQILLLTWTGIFLSCKLIMYFQAKYCRTYESSVESNYTNFENELEFATHRKTDGLLIVSPNFDTGLWCIATMCQQGWDSLPNYSSMRVIFITSLALSVVCYSAFCGKIVSELWNVPKPIKSLSALLSHAKNIYLVEASDTSGDVLEDLERRSADSLRKVRFQSIDHIYGKLLKNPGQSCVITWPDNVFEYVHEVVAQKDGKTKSSADAFICSTFSSFTFQASSNLFVPKKSELESVFNYRIIHGLQRGFIRRYWNIYKRQSFLSCLEDTLKVTTLDFTHVYFAFLVLFLGMVTSVMLLAAEVVATKLGWRFRFKLPWSSTLQNP